MAVILRTASDVTAETIFWVDFRNQSAGVGLRRQVDDAWAEVVAITNLLAEWANGEGELTAEQKADALRFLAGAVYE